MKNKFLNLIILSLLITVNFKCKNPIDELKPFKVNLNGNLANTLIDVNFKTNDPANLEPKNLNVRITGNDARYIFDENGYYNFPVTSGKISIILSPNANPTKEKPIVFTVEASADDCAPLKQDVYVFSKTQKLNLTLTFNTNNFLPTGTTYKKEDLNFLGKKAIDTVKFEMTRPDGIKFVVKYPIEGLSFILEKSVQFKIGEKITLAQETDSTAEITLDTNINTTVNFVQNINYKGQLADEKRMQADKIYPTGSTVTKQVIVGYKISNRETIYEWRTVFDTIPLSNVTASIYSASGFEEFGYYDEDGNYIDKPRRFSNVVGMPQVYFTTKSTGGYVRPIYTTANKGKIIECYLPTNSNYKMYYSGYQQSVKGDYYFQVKQIKKVSEENFFFDSIGRYKISFVDPLLSGNYFMFKNFEEGCGYTEIISKSTNIDFSKGFFGNIIIKRNGISQYNRLYENDWFRFPAYKNEEIELIYQVNHPEKYCSTGNSNIFTSQATKIISCNYVTQSFNYLIDYDTRAYAQSLPPTASVLMTASIICSGGNFVLPPDVSMQFRKINCNYSDYDYPVQNYLTLINGSLETDALQINQPYELKYTRTTETGRLLSVYDTITLDTKIPEQTIKDDKENYWEGTIKYDGKSFKIEFLFDNRKLKYKINGCGD
jgi:hypothetical protein